MVLGNAVLHRILHQQNTSALESAVQTGHISFRRQNIGLPSLQRKFLFFDTERGFTLLGNNRNAPPRPALSFTGSPCSEGSLGKKIMQMTNSCTTKQWPHSMDQVVRMAGRKNPWLSHYRKELSFIYLFSSLCN